jgi:asparagine synthase (glutamine-hydrolysing)
MSAIVGIYYLDNRPVNSLQLDDMLKSLAHRGPDGAEAWQEGPIGLGHGRLGTTPESVQEKLPLVNKTGDFILTADARIDNRNELIAALEVTDRPSNEITDGELILRAYERWSEHCPEKLLGDFAFALWDRRRQVLFCARDPFGVKPFYYYHSDRIFAFASEIKALLCLPGVPRRLNEVRVADYLVSILEDKVITFYREIFRLPPGHCMTVDGEKVSIRSYWSLDPTYDIRYGSNEEYAEAFHDLFREAVRCRLRSAFPIGSTLSGGLDSSSIVCMARKILAQDHSQGLQTFSAIFDTVPQCDERPFINAVLAQDGLKPHYIPADRLSPLADLECMFWHEDEAFYAPNLFIHWGLYKAAHQQNVRIFLDGLDGDTTVSHGLPLLTELFRAGKWYSLIMEIKDLSRHFNDSPWRLFRRYVLRPFTPKPIRRVWRVLRGRAQPDWMVDTVINPHFASRIGLMERYQTLLKGYLDVVYSSRENHWRRLTSGLIPFTLEVADKAAAAFSLEPRYPFFDRRLVEFCLALPPEQKLYRGWTRIILRRAMANVLPIEIQWRKDKSNLAPNFTQGLLAFERERLEEVILNNSNMVEEYVDISALREAYQRYLCQGDSSSALTVWKTVTLALWLRQTGLTP